jgi:hypothetical protein
MGWSGGPGEQAMSFICCVNDEEQFLANLATSPCFHGREGHELIAVRHATSAGEGFLAGLEQAAHPWLVLAHQDVYLPAGWPLRFQTQWRQAEAAFGPLGVAGVYGASLDPTAGHGRSYAGQVLDRQILRQETSGLPLRVDTLDELIILFRRETLLRPDPVVGFHLYGADLALQAHTAGLAVVTLDAITFHNSLCPFRLPTAFWASARTLKAKWPTRFPLATSCALLT